MKTDTHPPLLHIYTGTAKAHQLQRRNDGVTMDRMLNSNWTTSAVELPSYGSYGAG